MMTHTLYGTCTCTVSRVQSTVPFQYVHILPTPSMDVATAMCQELQGLGGVQLHMDTFSELAPWLEHEILGRDSNRSPPQLQPLGGISFYQAVPEWHNLDQRLEGSNYHAEVITP